MYLPQHGNDKVAMGQSFAGPIPECSNETRVRTWNKFPLKLDMGNWDANIMHMCANCCSVWAIPFSVVNFHELVVYVTTLAVMCIGWKLE